MSSYNTIVSDLLSKVDGVLEDFVYHGYQGLVDYLEVPLGAAIVLFFVIYGISISQGWIKGSVSGLTHSVFKIGVIYFIGMNWSHFSMYVYDLFYKVSSEIGAALLTSLNFDFSYNNESGINAGLQIVLSEIWTAAQTIFNAGGITNPGPWIGGILIGLIGLFFVGFALLEIIIAKCMLSILLVTAPLFIAFTLFESTQSFFDRWLGANVTYASLMIFISATLGIVITLDHWILADYFGSSLKKMTWIDTATAILVTWVCIGIIKRVAVLAMNIGGSVSTISANEMLAGTVGTFLNPSRGNGSSSKYRGSDGSAGQSKNQRSKESGSYSKPINPAVNDRSRFVDGRNHQDPDHHHSHTGYPNKPDNPVRPDRPDHYRPSDNHPITPDHNSPSHNHKENQGRSQAGRSNNHTVKKRKKEFEDYN